MKPNRTLGQNFLKCRWVVSTMIKSAELDPLKDIVLEVGPGTGILTRALAEKSCRVLAVEKDKKLAENLQKQDLVKVEIITGDILKTFSKLTKTYNLKSNSYKVVSNIPYYLTSRLLRILLEQGPQPSLIVLTIQKEVAKRICVKTGEMNLLSISVQTFGKPKVMKAVPAECFWPKPKIDSAILKISDISFDFFKKNGVLPKDFFFICRKGFSQPRKKLLNNLLPLFPGSKNELISGLQSIGLNPDKRPAELNPENWAKLTLWLDPSKTLKSS